MKRIIIITTILFFCASFGFSTDLVDMADSNQAVSTMYFEKNEYDYLLDPAFFNLLERSTLFFALDASADQFGEDTVGDGFRGAFAWIREGFSPLFALNYRTNISTFSASEEDNSEIDYQTYDAATGHYGQIDEIIDVSSWNNPLHRLMFHFGGRLDNSLINFGLQAYWNWERETGSSTSYTDTYTDTASISDATLSSKGDLTVTEYNLIDDADNVIAIEPEVGLDFGKFKSTISIGVGLYNLGTADDNWTETVTSYAGGLDPTVMDQTVVTSYTGSYYYDAGLFSCFTMDTSTPDNVNRTLLNLDTDNRLKLAEDLELEMGLDFALALYPDLTTVENTLTTGYSDASADPLESSRTDNTITTTLDNSYDLRGHTHAAIKKTFNPADNAAFHLGSYLGFTLDMVKDSRSRTETTRTQTDGDADGAYTTAAVDVDTSYSESGWEIQTRTNDYIIELGLPLAVSYSPVKTLTFHAGAETGILVSLTDQSSLETGDNGYLYETFTDNLDSANSYEQREKDGTNNTNNPVDDFTTSFSFYTTGSFGFTLELTDNFKIDAVALASTMAISSFSLTGIYSF